MGEWRDVAWILEVCKMCKFLYNMIARNMFHTWNSQSRSSPQSPGISYCLEAAKTQVITVRRTRIVFTIQFVLI